MAKPHRLRVPGGPRCRYQRCEFRMQIVLCAALGSLGDDIRADLATDRISWRHQIKICEHILRLIACQQAVKAVGGAVGSSSSGTWRRAGADIADHCFAVLVTDNGHDAARPLPKGVIRKPKQVAVGQFALIINKEGVIVFVLDRDCQNIYKATPYFSMVLMPVS